MSRSISAMQRLFEEGPYEFRLGLKKGDTFDGDGVYPDAIINAVYQHKITKLVYHVIDATLTNPVTNRFTRASIGRMVGILEDGDEVEIGRVAMPIPDGATCVPDICPACEKRVEDRDAVEIDGKFYHRNCTR